MEIRVLRYFLTVAREENITRAAEVLHITQPTLSRQLMQLEDELGVQLMVRGKTKIVLTEEGLLLRRRAQEIIDLTDKTQKEFLEHDSLMNGEIFIGGAETYAMSTIAKIIKEFHQLYPMVTYNFHSGNADDVKERIDKGLIDIGILSEPVDIEKYDFIRLPKKDIWGVLMCKDHPLAKKEVITPQDLKGQDIMCSKRDIVQNELESWFGDVFSKVHIIATYNLIYNASLLVESGVGIAFTLEKLIHVNDQLPIVFKKLSPQLETGNVVVWKKHQVFSPATTCFLNYLNNALKA